MNSKVEENDIQIIETENSSIKPLTDIILRPQRKDHQVSPI
jgi:hypothetical protein